MRVLRESGRKGGGAVVRVDLRLEQRTEPVEGTS
jgi:hypothetical protein